MLAFLSQLLLRRSMLNNVSNKAGSGSLLASRSFCYPQRSEYDIVERFVIARNGSPQLCVI